MKKNIQIKYGSANENKSYIKCKIHFGSFVFVLIFILKIFYNGMLSYFSYVDIYIFIFI